MTDRLTQHLVLPPTDFYHCQLCCKEVPDTMDLKLFVECGEQDQQEPGNMFLCCDEGNCKQLIELHPRCYKQIPWFLDENTLPGFFPLVCGLCENREGFTCKANQKDITLTVDCHPLNGLRVCGEETSYCFDRITVDCSKRNGPILKDHGTLQYFMGFLLRQDKQGLDIRRW